MECWPRRIVRNKLRDARGEEYQCLGVGDVGYHSTQKQISRRGCKCTSVRDPGPREDRTRSDVEQMEAANKLQHEKSFRAHRQRGCHEERGGNCQDQPPGTDPKRGIKRAAPTIGYAAWLIHTSRDSAFMDAAVLLEIFPMAGKDISNRTWRTQCPACDHSTIRTWN